MQYENVAQVWIRGVPPGGMVVGDPKDPQIGRLLEREQIKPKDEQKEGSESA